MRAHIVPPQDAARRAANVRLALILAAVPLTIFALIIIDHWPHGH